MDNKVFFVPHTNWESQGSGTNLKTKEIPCLTGKGKPTAETAGAVGCWYMDTDSGTVYKCTAAADGVYTWIDLVNSDELRCIVEAYLQENPPEDGADGGHYTPVITQPTADTMKVEFLPSRAGMAAVEPVEIKLPVGSGNDSGQNPTQGLTAEEKSLLLSVVNNALYGADIGAVKARLNALWGGSGGDSGNTDPGTLYTISTKFVNVSIDNTATSATANSAFNAVLTPTVGELASVTITMGGVDVTADVYADGVITIPVVTGNVVIEASASAYVNLIADAEWRAGTKEDWENGLTYNKNSGRDYTFPAGTYYFYALHKNAAGGTPGLYVPNGDGTYTTLDSSIYTAADNNGLFKDGKFNKYNKETSSYYRPVDELYLIEVTVTFHQDVTGRIVWGSGWYILEHPEYVWCFNQPYNPHKDTLGWEV